MGIKKRKTELWDGADGKPAFIQWKGTNVCMDLHCTVCKHHNHYDTDFAYYVQCAKCKTVFEMCNYVRFRVADPKDDNYSAHNPKQSNFDIEDL